MSDEVKAPERDPRELEFPYEFKLSKVVEAHGDSIKVLVINEPTGDDVVTFGLLNGFASTQFFPLVSKLAKVPESTLKACSAKDILRLATTLNRFFEWAGEAPAS